MMHKVLWTPPMWLSNLWWLLRGVGVPEYRQLCARCGRTGQVHWSLSGCLRFRR